MNSQAVKPHCRLFVILARSSPTGVIFRRGPTKWVQLIKWNTDDDSFEAGQWFHGRIYEHRCDMSPDGSKVGKELVTGQRAAEKFLCSQ